MLRSMIAPLSVGVLAFAMVLIVLQLSQTDLVSRLGITQWMDKIEDVPPEEIQRRGAIRQLAISEEKKQILINKQIFLGAGRHMVVYALGTPKRRKDMRPLGREEMEAWIYHFADDYRPTVLEFDQHSLTKAYKASLIEIEQLGKDIPVN